MWTLRANRECATSSSEPLRGICKQQLMAEHVDGEGVTDHCILPEVTELDDQCAVDRERNAWDHHLKHTTCSSQRCRCHARAANARPFALGRCHAPLESSRSCIEAEHANMFSAPVPLDAQNQTIRRALRIGPVGRSRGQELMIMSKANDDTASATTEARYS